MMNNLLTYLMVMMVLIAPYKESDDLQKGEDMSKWSFKILLQHSDQLDELKVVRFFNKESGRYGFCLEPEVDYDPVNNVYYKENYDNKDIYDIVKAYDQLGEDYYIGAQLMIWEKTSGIRYSFEGKDASQYGEEKILEVISSFKGETEETENMHIKAVLDEVVFVQLEDIDEYRIIQNDIKDAKVDGDGIRFRLKDHDRHKIVLESRKKETDGSYRYTSETSQDLYSYEGDHEFPKMITIDIEAEDDFTLIYHKVDENDQAIEGAEFTLYELSDQGNEILDIIRKDAAVDLKTLLNADDKLKLSERYERYRKNDILSAKESGYFDYETGSGNTGRVYVCENKKIVNDDLNSYIVQKIGTYKSGSAYDNYIYGLKRNAKYILCESHPRNGYEFRSDPCVLIDPNEDTEVKFVNHKRKYDLRLYKENPEHSVLLNGAKFLLQYKDGDKDKEKILITGGLCIKQKDEKPYVLYRHEKDQNIYVGDFKDGYFIKEDAIPGTYLYGYCDDYNMNDSSLLVKSINVVNGGFEIGDMPYDAKIKITELEAPKGYHIDEADFTIIPSLDYSDIVFRNYRVNSFLIMPENRHVIPKTCIGN